MAFGFFKKNNKADVIYRNGHIYTQDPEFPQAEAVACQQGKVLAVGDYAGMEEIIGEDTLVVDLKGQYMFPGFLDVHDTPVLRAFADRYFQIDPVWDVDTILEEGEAYAEDCDAEIIFGYGYNENMLTDYESGQERQNLLDQISTETPVLFLSHSGMHCWVNTVAAAIIEGAAEDEGVEFVTADYILSLLAPFDPEEAYACVKEDADAITDKGFTAVLDLCAPDYFSRVYRDALLSMLGEGEEAPFRFFGSLYLNRPIPPQLSQFKLDSGRTACTEIDDRMAYDILKIELCDDESLSFFSQDTLDAICLSAADKGYHIHLDALDKPSIEKALLTFDKIRGKGYRKNTLTLASKRESLSDDEFLSTWPCDYLNESVFGQVTSVEEALDELTINAARLIGRENELGSIERGKRADFTVFEENPFDRGLSNFAYMQASLTILDGRIVYDLEEACNEEIYNLMTSMQL